MLHFYGVRPLTSVTMPRELAYLVEHLASLVVGWVAEAAKREALHVAQ
jgi:hypothetical protein